MLCLFTNASIILQDACVVVNATQVINTARIEAVLSVDESACIVAAASSSTMKTMSTPLLSSLAFLIGISVAACMLVVVIVAVVVYFLRRNRNDDTETSAVVPMSTLSLPLASTLFVCVCVFVCLLVASLCLKSLMSHRQLVASGELWKCLQ